MEGMLKQGTADLIEAGVERLGDSGGNGMVREKRPGRGRF